MKFFPVLPILGLIFITLKLTGHIAWSWWLVLLPFYVGIPIFIVVFLVLIVCAAIAANAR